ncbi:hypothetical protein AB0H47_35110 [Streptomyces globisporus]
MLLGEPLTECFSVRTSSATIRCIAAASLAVLAVALKRVMRFW